jgi:hypothetical protein
VKEKRGKWPCAMGWQGNGEQENEKGIEGKKI